MIRIISISVSLNGEENAFKRIVNVFNKMGRSIIQSKHNGCKSTEVEVIEIQRRAFKSKKQYAEFMESMSQSLKMQHGDKIKLYPQYAEK